jgi:hypothetical protein
LPYFDLLLPLWILLCALGSHIHQHIPEIFRPQDSEKMMKILTEEERDALLHTNAPGGDGDGSGSKEGQLYYPAANADPNQFNILKVRVAPTVVIFTL